MAINTRSQANQPPQNQANQLQQITPSQTDNTVSAFSIQLAQIMEEIRAMMMSFDTRMGALEARYGITPPAPQEAQEEKANLEENAEITAEKQEQQPLQQANAPLYQATVEDFLESTEKDGNSIATMSIISTIPRLCTIQTSGDQAARLSIVLFAYQHALFGSLFGFLPTSFFGSFFASQIGCIRCMEGMEASGQG